MKFLKFYFISYLKYLYSLSNCQNKSWLCGNSSCYIFMISTWAYSFLNLFWSILISFHFMMVSESPVCHDKTFLVRDSKSLLMCIIANEDDDHFKWSYYFAYTLILDVTYIISFRIPGIHKHLSLLKLVCYTCFTLYNID